MGLSRTHGFLLFAAAAVLVLLVGPARGAAVAKEAVPASGKDPEVAVRAMQLVTPMQGWALTNLRLVWTDDGGEQWADIAPPGVPAAAIKGVFFLDAEHGWAVAPGPPDARGSTPLLALRTADGGNTWQTAQLAAPSWKYSDAIGDPASLSFVDAQHGWAMVKIPSSSNFSLGDLFETTDGGTTWVEREIPIGGAIRFISPTDGWTADGQFGLYVTRDGGISWQQQQVIPPTAFNANYPHYDLPVFTSAEDGILLVAFAWEPGGPAFYTTHDGGATWTLATSVACPRPQCAGDIFPSAVIDISKWVAATAGSEGVQVFRTDSGGESWEEFTPDGLPAAAGVSDLAFATAEVGWGRVGFGECRGFKTDCVYHEELYRTTDEGRTWTRLNP